MTDVRVVLCTTPPDAAETIAGALVERKLAACVNIVPGVRSVYRWKGAIERAEETLLIVKTTAGRIDALTEAIRSIHPYEVPEIIALDVTGGLPGYLAWVLESAGTEGP